LCFLNRYDYEYIFINETRHPELLEASEFAYLLNSCGKTGNASIGIAIAMGDRNKSIIEAKEILKKYREKLEKSVDWILNQHKLHKLEFVQYFYGEDEIPEEIIGTICSSLLNSQLIDKTKPIFGYADKIGEDFYKVSSRATLDLINSGVNLAEVIKVALKLTNLDSLGGGHPPAAGTKIKKELIHEFLLNCNKIVKKQLSWKR